MESYDMKCVWHTQYICRWNRPLASKLSYSEYFEWGREDWKIWKSRLGWEFEKLLNTFTAALFSEDFQTVRMRPFWVNVELIFSAYETFSTSESCFFFKNLYTGQQWFYVIDIWRV